MKKVLLIGMLAALLSFAACNGNNENATIPAFVEPELQTTAAAEPPSPPQEESPPTEAEPVTEPPTEYVPAPSPTGTNAHGALHRVSYNNNTAYLFGTIHVGHEEWFPLADIVEYAIRRADIIAVEVAEVAAGSTEGMEDALLQFLFLADGQTWADILPDTHHAHLQEVITAWGMPYEAVNTMNPALLINTLIVGLVMELTELDINASVDFYVTAIANEYNIPIIGLESIEQQSDIIFNPPHDVLLAQIMDFGTPEEVLEFMLSGEMQGMDELAYYYITNNLDAINAGFALEMGAQHDCIAVTYMREIAMNWRSTYYANRIIYLLQETNEPTTFFVAVGLSHIIRSGAGEEFTDIVQQLTLAGFDVERLWE